MFLRNPWLLVGNIRCFIKRRPSACVCPTLLARQKAAKAAFALRPAHSEIRGAICASDQEVCFLV
jgi:hypothetical protein